jgi:hypothetical protein
MILIQGYIIFSSTQLFTWFAACMTNYNIAHSDKANLAFQGCPLCFIPRIVDRHLQSRLEQHLSQFLFARWDNWFTPLQDLLF